MPRCWPWAGPTGRRWARWAQGWTGRSCTASPPPPSAALSTASPTPSSIRTGSAPGFRNRQAADLLATPSSRGAIELLGPWGRRSGRAFHGRIRALAPACAAALRRRLDLIRLTWHRGAWCGAECRSDLAEVGDHCSRSGASEGLGLAGPVGFGKVLPIGTCGLVPAAVLPEAELINYWADQIKGRRSPAHPSAWSATCRTPAAPRARSHRTRPGRWPPPRGLPPTRFCAGHAGQGATPNQHVRTSAACHQWPQGV